MVEEGDLAVGAVAGARRAGDAVGIAVDTDIGSVGFDELASGAGGPTGL